MESWVVEGDFALKEAYEDDGASVSDEVEGGVHGAGVAGGVEDEVREIGAEGVGQRFVRIDLDGAFDPEAFAGEGEAVFGEVCDDDVLGDVAEKGEDAEPDRAGAEDEGGVALLRVAAVGSVAADAEHLDEGELFGGGGFCGVELVNGDVDLGAHASVAMDAEDLKVFAAVGFAFLRCGGGWVVEVGLDGDELAGLEFGGAVEFDDLGGKLVAEDTGVFEERLTSVEGVDVGAADADGADADAGFALVG